MIPPYKKKIIEKLKGKVKAIAQKVGQKDKDMETKRENITFEINPTKKKLHRVRLKKMGWKKLLER